MTENRADDSDNAQTSDDSSAIEAFVRLIEDPEFASALASDPETALEDYDVTEEIRKALVVDATALHGEDEVAGFVMVGMGQKDAFMTQGILTDRGHSVRVQRSAGFGASVVVEPYNAGFARDSRTW